MTFNNKEIVYNIENILGLKFQRYYINYNNNDNNYSDKILYYKLKNDEKNKLTIKLSDIKIKILKLYSNFNVENLKITGLGYLIRIQIIINK
jgi:D-Tyr-tRNAtyr deacylase